MRLKRHHMPIQRVVKQNMTLDIHNWSSSVHQEIYKIVKDEIFLIINQVDARMQNFEIQFLKEAAKFVRDFQSLAKEVDESLAKHKALEWKMSVLIEQNLDSLNSVPTTKESKVVDNDKVIAPGMFRINPFKNSKEEKFLPNKPTKASVRTNLITVSQPHPRRNTKNDRVPSVSKRSRIKNKEVEVEEHPINFVISKNKKHISSECNNVKLAVRNNKSKIVCAMFKQCLITANHDVCVLNHVNGMNSHSKKQKASVSNIENQTKHKAPVWKPKNVGSKERLASPKPSKPGMHLRWSPTGKMFDIKGKLIASSLPKYVCVRRHVCSKHMTENIKLLINFIWKFLGTVRFGNDHVAVNLGFSDLQWGNILITMVYFFEGLGHNLFSVGHFYDSDLEVAFRRNTCFVKNLEGVDLLKGNRITNLYTINLHDMTSASPICLMARTTSTKSWLWHQCLSHLNFNTINDLARNDLVTDLPKFKYHKEHLCPSCEQGKRKRASHLPKPVPNFKQRLHLLHMDLCGPMRIASINAPDHIIKIDQRYRNQNQVLQEYFNSVGITHQASSIRTPQQNGVVERRNRTLVEAARTMLIFSCAPLFLLAEAITTACYTQNRSLIHQRFDKTSYELINSKKPNISFLYVFGALCYPKNDHEDHGKLGAKGDIGFLIGYLLIPCAYRLYNRRTRLTMLPSTITTQQPTEGELDLLFEAMYDDHIAGQPSATTRTILAAQAPQVVQTPTTITTTTDTASTPTNSSFQARNFPITSQEVDKLKTQQHVQHQPATIADNVPNAMFDDNTFVNPFATPSTSAAESSSSQYVDPSNMHRFYQPYPHEY
ncbi:retrovirus-related pol polyprotein from transposon TNT 1-94 [Tanacetum coccineum]